MKRPTKPVAVPVPRIRTLRDDDTISSPEVKPTTERTPAAPKRRTRRPKFVF